MIDKGRLFASESIMERALKLIGSDGGVLQSELRFMLGVDSKKCSRIVINLERKGLIKRDKVSAKGKRTYLIRRAPQHGFSLNSISIDNYLTELYILYLIKGLKDNRYKAPTG
jgi:predicted transcriptional regulator